MINIIFTLSNKDEDKTKPSFGRIATFGHVLDMPHVHWTTFKNGKRDLEGVLGVIDLLLLYLF